MLHAHRLLMCPQREMSSTPADFSTFLFLLQFSFANKLLKHLVGKKKINGAFFLMILWVD